MIYCITIIIIIVLLYMCDVVWVEMDDKYMINYICGYINDKVSIWNKGRLIWQRDNYRLW